MSGKKRHLVTTRALAPRWCVYHSAEGRAKIRSFARLPSCRSDDEIQAMLNGRSVRQPGRGVGSIYVQEKNNIYIRLWLSMRSLLSFYTQLEARFSVCLRRSCLYRGFHRSGKTEGEPLGGDSERRRRRLVLTSRQWRRDGEGRGDEAKAVMVGRAQQLLYIRGTTAGYIYLFIYFTPLNRFARVLPQLVGRLHCRRLFIRFAP